MYIDFMGTDAAIFRTLGKQTAMRTDQYNSRWLNGEQSPQHLQRAACLGCGTEIIKKHSWENYWPLTGWGGGSFLSPEDLGVFLYLARERGLVQGRCGPLTPARLQTLHSSMPSSSLTALSAMTTSSTSSSVSGPRRHRRAPPCMPASGGSAWYEAPCCPLPRPSPGSISPALAESLG